MGWRRRTDTRENDMAHGITFRMWETSGQNIRGEAAHEDSKLHIDGVASLTLAENQYRYGDELIAQLYGANVRVLARRAANHSRVQIFLGQANAETAAVLREIAGRIDELEQRRREKADDHSGN